MTDGWLAARAEGVARDSFLHPVYAHASPVYVGSGIPPTASREAAAHFTRQIDTAIDLITDSLRYTTDAQRQEVLHLFHSGRSIYERLGI